MSNSSYKYCPDENYCNQAKHFQSVLNGDETKQKLIDKNKAHSPQDVQADRLGTLYSYPDSYQMGSIQDNQIYIATTDAQHNQIVDGKHVDAQGGLSGYFSDQATIEACKSGNVLDNTKYNEACQIAPYREDGILGVGDATYKPHVDCFEIDKDALYNNYGTYDFNAAISKCEANNQFGSGGGNQGYNPYISDMIDNGTLKHNPQNSYSDKSISNSDNCNENHLINSKVSENKADKMYSDAYARSQDCVNNNTPHPSVEACNNGFDKNNAINTGCATGNATVSVSQTAGELPSPQQSNSSNNNDIAGSLPEEKPVKPEHNNNIAGANPANAESIDIFNKNIENYAGQNFMEGINKKTGDSINSATGIT